MDRNPSNEPLFVDVRKVTHYDYNLLWGLLVQTVEMHHDHAFFFPCTGQFNLCLESKAPTPPPYVKLMDLPDDFLHSDTRTYVEWLNTEIYKYLTSPATNKETPLVFKSMLSANNPVIHPAHRNRPKYAWIQVCTMASWLFYNMDHTDDYPDWSQYHQATMISKNDVKLREEWKENVHPPPTGLIPLRLRRMALIVNKLQLMIVKDVLGRHTVPGCALVHSWI